MGHRKHNVHAARLGSAGLLLGISVMLSGCGGDLANVAAPQQLTTGATPAPDQAAGTRRATPVVPGRPARMYIATAFDAKCAPVALKSVAVRKPPVAGEVTFRAGQSTVVNESATGKCLGSTLTGTGVYYTAKPGASGRDAFSIDIVMPSGEVASRTFDVSIAE